PEAVVNKPFWLSFRFPERVYATSPPGVCTASQRSGCMATSSALPVTLIAPGVPLTPSDWKPAATREPCPSPATGAATVPDRVAWKPTVLALARLCDTDACAFRVALAPVIATYMALSIIVRTSGYRTSADVDHGLRDLVLGGDHLRVGLEVALRGDHVDQLLGQVDVGGLQRAALDQPELRGTGHPDARIARFRGFRPAVVAQ